MLDCVLSAAARYRNQVAKGTREADSGVRLPISSTIAPKPPLCRSRSVLRSACSILDHGLDENEDRLRGPEAGLIMCLECFLLLTNSTLRFGASRSNGFRPQQASHRLRQSVDLTSRMWPKASSVQSVFMKRRNKISFRQNEVARVSLDACLRDSAAHPEESRQIYANGCRGRGIERICDIDPTADLFRLGHLLQERKRNGGSSRALGTD